MLWAQLFGGAIVVLILLLINAFFLDRTICTLPFSKPWTGGDVFPCAEHLGRTLRVCKPFFTIYTAKFPLFILQQM